jgi:transcriptional regulator with XRE-family HTH domain
MERGCVKRKIYTRSFPNRRFCQTIRERRHQLDLTQEQLARRIKKSTNFIGDLEIGRRRPSAGTVVRLAKVLGLDQRELFLLANAWARAVFTPPTNTQSLSAWEQFTKNHQLQRTHKVTKSEMEMLSSVASLGELRAPHEFIYVLNAVRQALGR